VDTTDWRLPMMAEDRNDVDGFVNDRIGDQQSPFAAIARL
jgi:hypothetical protein